MKKSSILVVVALAAAVMTAPLAFAHAAVPSCAEAQLAFNRAQDALDKAVADDKAAAAAKGADEELERAKSALAAANEALQVARADVAAKQARLEELKNEPEPDEAAIADAEAALAASVEVQATAQARAGAAQARVTAAETAARTDANALQDIADKTDADALAKARDEARKLADTACGRVTTTPPTATPAPEEDLDCADFPLSSGRTAQQVFDETPGKDPHGLDADGDRRACEPGQDTADDGSDRGDDDDRVVTPRGGVATGGGPA